MTASTIEWLDQDNAHRAQWRSERAAPAPAIVRLADDTLSADAAYRLASDGVGLLWRGDFQNARHLLQALDRRLTKRAQYRPAQGKNAASNPTPTAPASLAEAFHAQRKAQARRARILGSVLIGLDDRYGIALRRAPDVRLACEQAWGASPAAASAPNQVANVCSLRELLGIVSAHEWRKKGVEVAQLGLDASKLSRRIHPHYGVFSPIRGEYIALVAQAPLPLALASAKDLIAIDVGTGTGVLAAVLAHRGVGKVIATDLSPRALACAQDNIARLAASAMKGATQVQVVAADLFPDSAVCRLAHLIVCNPPWLPAPARSALEQAVYDEGSKMLLGYLNGLAAHLMPGGEGWLILSDLAERLGLRSRADLLHAIDAAGLKVLDRIATAPKHPKAQDAADPLHPARSQEVTSLWRLAKA